MNAFRSETALLNKEILSDPLNRKVFATGAEVYLVGGYIRDILSRGARSKDLDYVVAEGFEEVVSRVSGILGAAVFELGRGGVSRMVLRDSTTLDFSRLESTLDDDLRGRDFTVNAMAWSPLAGLIDPLGGHEDIKKGVLRGISRKNFEADPLRLLRAYRLAAENSWTIQRETRLIIKEMPREIRRPATERITLEFFRLLKSPEPSSALETSLRDGILTEIISLSYKELQKNLKLVSSIVPNLKKIPEIHYLRFSSQGLGYLGLLRLEQLLRGSETGANLMSLSRNISKRIRVVNKYYDSFKRLPLMKPAELFDLLSETEEAALDLMILTGNAHRLGEFRRFKRIMRKGLLRSEEIAAATGRLPGPDLGRIIHQLKGLQFDGSLRGKREALRRLRRMSAGDPPGGLNQPVVGHNKI